MAKTGTKSTRQRTDQDHRGDNAATEARDDTGRFVKSERTKEPSVKMPKVALPKVTMPKVKVPKVKVPELTTRNAALGALGAGVAVAVVAAGAALFRGRLDKPIDSVDHAFAQDDDTAAVSSPAKIVTPADVIDDDKRAAFAPATKPVPSRVEAMGNGDD